MDCKTIQTNPNPCPDEIELKKHGNDKEGGQIIDFPKDFVTGDNNGQLLFGHILIETGDEADEPYDED